MAMAPTLQEEIKQSKPFDSLQQEAMLNIMRTAAVLQHRAEQEFRDFGLTATQYNVLRIVQGAGEAGISQCDIAGRLVAETPDVPRLVKRTETAGLIARATDPEDRRSVRVKLTPAGVKLLRDMEPKTKETAKGLFPKLKKKQLRALNDLLNLCREIQE